MILPDHRDIADRWKVPVELRMRSTTDSLRNVSFSQLGDGVVVECVDFMGAEERDGNDDGVAAGEDGKPPTAGEKDAEGAGVPGPAGVAVDDEEVGVAEGGIVEEEGDEDGGAEAADTVYGDGDGDSGAGTDDVGGEADAGTNDGDGDAVDVEGNPLQSLFFTVSSGAA